MKNPITYLIALGLGGRSAVMLVNMVVLVITSRLLSPVQFGEFAICQFVIDLAQAASSAFISIPLLHSSRIRGTDYHFRFTLTLIIAILAGAVTLLIAHWLGGWLRMSSLAALLAFIAPVVVARVLASFFTGFLQRRMNIAAIVQAQSASQILSAVLVTLPLAWAGQGVWSLVIGLAAAVFGEMALLALSARVVWRITLAGNVPGFVGNGWPTLVNRLLVFAADSSDRLVVGRAFGPYPLGLYSRAASLVRLPINLLGMPTQNAFTAWVARNKTRPQVVERAIDTFTRVQSYALPIAAVGFWLATPAIVRLMLGNQWIASIPIARVLFIGSLARLGAIPLEAASVILGYAWASARRQIAATVVLVVGVTIAVAHAPLWVACAVSASRVVYYLLGLLFGVRRLGVCWAGVAQCTASSSLVAVSCAAATYYFTGFLGLRGSLAELSMVALYALSTLALTMLGPARLIGPAGPRVRGLLCRLAMRTGHPASR